MGTDPSAVDLHALDLHPDLRAQGCGETMLEGPEGAAGATEVGQVKGRLFPSA